MKSLTLPTMTLAGVLLVPARAHAASESLLGDGVSDVLRNGRGIMALILGASILGLALAFERFVSLRRRRLCPKELVKAVENATESGDFDSLGSAADVQAPLGRIVKAGLRWRERGPEEMEKAMESAANHEIVRLRRPVRPIALLASIMPLMGLLGTILGMIRTFNGLQGVSTSARVETLAPGIAQALYTTAAGLIVAIPFLVAYHYLSAQVTRAAGEWSLLGTNLVLAAKGQPPVAEESDS